jgi:hypothetical protein
MNFFRLLGDLSHLAAIIILLLKIWKTRSCAGISGNNILLVVSYGNLYFRVFNFQSCKSKGFFFWAWCLGESNVMIIFLLAN